MVLVLGPLARHGSLLRLLVIGCANTWRRQVADTVARPAHGCDDPGVAKGARVHANVVFVNVDASQADPARRGLHEHVIPRTSHTAGFVAGYWLEPVNGKGISVTFWENEHAARDAAGRIQPASSPTTG